MIRSFPRHFILLQVPSLGLIKYLPKILSPNLYFQDRFRFLIILIMQIAFAKEESFLFEVAQVAVVFDFILAF